MDKRKLKKNKHIIGVTHNEKNDTISVLIGANTTSSTVISAIAYQIEVVAERMGVETEQVFNTIRVALKNTLEDGGE